MWGLRILNGVNAGQVHALSPGKTKIGRGATCQIQVSGNGISKEHVEITVMQDKVLITDLRSSNGTYLNGVRIQGGLLKVGDKILVSQVLCDVVLMQERTAMEGTIRPLALSGPPGAQLPQNYNPGAVIPQMGGLGMPPAPPSQSPPATVGGFVNYQTYKLNQYMDNVALPGVYKLPQMFEFRFVLMGFVAVYIFAVTLLSLVPLRQITSESVSVESKRRALTVARALSEINQRVLRSGDFSGFRTDLVLKEEGIEDAYVVGRDGKVMAPPERIGLSPKEAGFIGKMKGSLREMSDVTMDGRVAASVPVVAFDAELQQNVAKAYAVVIYNPGNLTFDDGRAFSLFVQMLTLAVIIGIALFYLLYKMIEHPFRLLHEQLDVSLREGRDQVSIDFNFPALQGLLTSINSLLSRVAASGTGDQMQVGKGSRDSEIANIMQLIGYPSILIGVDGIIVRISPTFETLTGIASERLVGAKINDIPDPAMQQNFNHLMSQSQINLSQIFTDTLEIGGHNFNLNCQALANASGDVEYYLITVNPSEQEGAA